MGDNTGIARIPFGFEESGEQELAGGSALAVNVLIDGKGAIRRRPGITTTTGAPSTVVNSAGIDGIYVTEMSGELFAVSAAPPSLRSIYRIDGGSAFDLTNGFSQQALRGTRRPTFAETEAGLFIAGGDEVQKVLLQSGYASSRLANVPTIASHVVVQAQTALVNSLETPFNQVAYSSAGTGAVIDPFETWSGASDNGVVYARMRPSKVVALHENTNEVWAFQETGTQIFVTDPAQNYVEGRSDENGCGAAYSVIKYREAFAWINQHKQIIISNARGPEIISGPIQKTLDDTDITGAWGFAAELDQFSILAWMFPVAGFGLCYQIGGGWSRWAGHDGETWANPLIMSHARRWGADKEHIVGLTDGRIGTLSTSVYTDLDDPIKAYCRSGYLDRGSQERPADVRKACKSVRLVFKTDPTTALAPVGTLRWRDEDGNWRQRMNLVPRNGVVEFRSLGVYRRRQWEIEWNDDAEISLISATEEFDILSN
jgi:hypothetical protein